MNPLQSSKTISAVKKFDLEERLIDFSVLVIEISKKMPKIKASSHLSGQLLRSGTSAALNYGEAQSGESRKDFIHKMSIVLKELRETLVCLKIIERSQFINDSTNLIQAKKECNELVSIFVKSLQTVKRNSRN